MSLPYPLLQTLQDQDIGHLRIIARFWGFDPPQGGPLNAARVLARAMTEPENLLEIYESLPPALREALDTIHARGGSTPLAQLTRRFGPIRRIGPGRRDRIKAWQEPASPIEALWYRGLIALGFADTPTGLQEFAFIPTDLRLLLPQARPAEQAPLGCPGPPPDAWRTGASAADDMTSLLAALRRRPGQKTPLSPERRATLGRFLFSPESLDLLLVLGREAEYLTPSPLSPDPERIRAFLDLDHPAANRRLLQLWMRSVEWNDLSALPTLSAGPEGWPNDPLTSRQAALQLMEAIPAGTWWDLDQFVADVRESEPAFQRPGGDFSTWYLRRAGSGEFLQGIDHWAAVDGALLRFLIRGPMHWMGAVEFYPGAGANSPPVFRLTTDSGALFGHPAAGLPQGPEPAPTRALPDGRLRVPSETGLALRYQIARFTSWEALQENEYIFRLTPSALHEARAAGLRLDHVRAILDQAMRHPLPKPLREALGRWDRKGTEASVDRALVLQVGDPEVLDNLRANKWTARLLGEPLGPKAALVSERDVAPLLAAAARMGLLIDPPSPAGSDREI
jgi:hypothetical protein